MKSEIESTRHALAVKVEIFSNRRAEFQKIKSEYVQTLQRQKSLTEKSAALQAEVEASDLDFKQEFSAANYERTPAVNKTLQRKHDAKAMREEIEAALVNINRQIKSLQMEGGPKAARLLREEALIEKNFVKLKMLEAMASIPQEFLNALALTVEYFTKDGEIDFVFKGLKSQASETGEKTALPFEKITVAPFTSSEFNWTPIQIKQAKKEMEAGAVPDSIQANRPAHNFFASH